MNINTTISKAIDYLIENPAYVVGGIAVVAVGFLFNYTVQTCNEYAAERAGEKAEARDEARALKQWRKNRDHLIKVQMPTIRARLLAQAQNNP